MRTDIEVAADGSRVSPASRAARSRAACAGLGVILLGAGVGVPGCNPGAAPTGEGAPPTTSPAPVAEADAKTDAETDAETDARTDARRSREDHVEGAPAPNSAWRDPYEIRSADGEPLIFHRTPVDAPPHDLASLSDALAATLDALPTLDPKARLILHNDLWGVLARLGRATRSTPELARLRGAALTLLRALAPTPDAISQELTTPELARVLPAAEGWREVASELPALNHELAFGDRRLFRLFRRQLGDGGEELALAGHLLVIDRDGVVRRSSIIGEVELLSFRSGELVAAEVYELVRSGDRVGTLREAPEVAQIPGPGADSLIAEFDPPQALSELPCLRCHHDDSRMSLPNPALDPRLREAGVLARAQASADEVGPSPETKPRDQLGRMIADDER